MGVAASPLQAQRLVQIGSVTTCARCLIELEHVATVGDDDGLGMLGSVVIARDSRGRFYIFDYSDRGPIKLYAPDGTFVRVIGGEGRGPGEYLIVPAIVVGAGDTVHVFDSGNLRHTVLSPSLAVVRTHLIDVNIFPFQCVQLPGGDFVLNGIRRTAESLGYPLHRFTHDGGFVGSFGTDDTFVTPQTEYQKARRTIAAAEGGGVWAAHPTEYRLEHWDDQGQLVTQLVRNADWFPPHDNYGVLSPDRPPEPRIVAVRVIDGNVWVVIHVGSAEWRRWIRRRRGRDGVYWEAEAYERVYDTVIEVIDPTRGSLIASTRFEHLPLGFLDAAHVYSARGATGDVKRYDVWRVRLRNP